MCVTFRIFLSTIILNGCVNLSLKKSIYSFHSYKDYRIKINSVMNKSIQYFCSFVKFSIIFDFIISTDVLLRRIC